MVSRVGERARQKDESEEKRRRTQAKGSEESSAKPHLLHFSVVESVLCALRRESSAKRPGIEPVFLSEAKQLDETRVVCSRHFKQKRG